MQKAPISIEKWIVPKYKAYSLYVCTKRAIPHLIDGFKPGQRKIMHTAKRRAVSFIKVISLSGYCVAESNYHHGDKSLNDTISLMAQDFTCSNNYPLLEGQGGFGNRFGASPSAPRYIFVKLSENYEILFDKRDVPVLNKSDDEDSPEPEFYVPTIPYVLLNGVSGIAVGYTTHIPSYNPNHIVKNIENILKGSTKKIEVAPYYSQYIGKIQREDDAWAMYGKFERVNTTTIRITEIPMGMTTAKYKAILNVLVDDGTIKDYDDLSATSWEFIIRAPRTFVALTDKELVSVFKLRANIKEELNVVFDDKVIPYGNNVHKLISDFVEVRLEFYNKRRVYILNSMRDSIIKLFIKFSINKYLKSQTIKKLNKKEVVEYITSHNSKMEAFFNDVLDGTDSSYIDDIEEIAQGVLQEFRLNEAYTDKMGDYQDRIIEIHDEHNVLYAKSDADLYTEDLSILKKKIGVIK